MSLWLQFVLCTGVIFLSGSRLSLIADIIAEKTGLGRTWIGVILLASVKSLPELITAFRFFLFVCSGSVLLQTHRVRSSTFRSYFMHHMTLFGCSSDSPIGQPSLLWPGCLETTPPALHSSVPSAGVSLSLAVRLQRSRFGASNESVQTSGTPKSYIGRTLRTTQKPWIIELLRYCR